ncbi:MAG: trypsin-like peptidase domain-containing protein [Streptosporangiaceae bacterium]
MTEETRGSDDAAEENVAEKQHGFARPDGPGGDQLLVKRPGAGAPPPTSLDGIEQPPPPPYQESTPLYQDAPPPYQPGYGEQQQQQQQQQQQGYHEQQRPGFAPAAPGAFWPGTRPPQGPPPPFQPPQMGPPGPGAPPPNWAPVPPPPASSSRSGVGLGAFAIIALVIALIAGAVGAGIAVLVTDDSSSPSTVSLKDDNDKQVAKVRDPKSVAGVAQQVLPSVVTVKVDLGNGEGGTGTGFIVQNGYIITNNHVVAGLGTAGTLKIVFSDGKESSATVKGTSPSNDVAVIKPETTHNLPPLELGNSDDLAQGDPVIAVGSPLGLQGSVTTGIISALNRVVPTRDENGTDSHVIVALQTDAAINPGNSGGPLIDATTGKVIGMNTAIASLGGGSGQESGSIGLGFALPINRVQSVATNLISGQAVTKTVIGISMDTRYQGEGVKIATTGAAPLTKGGPAEKAGLKPGDVITSADGKPLNIPEDLLLVVTSHNPGDKIKVSFKRGGQEQTVDVTLGAGKS